MPHSTAQYEHEKAIGVRRPSGALNLAQLKPIHYKLLSLHLQGYRNSEIAIRLNTTEATVSRIINDPLAQQYLSEVYKSEDSRIRALHGKSVDAISETLEKGNRPNDRLRAARMVMEMNGKYDGKGGGGETAEDVVSRVLNMVNVQVNLNAPDAGKAVNGEAGQPAALPPLVADDGLNTLKEVPRGKDRDDTV